MSKVSGLIGKGNTFAEAFEQNDITTDIMVNSILKWYDLYYNNEKTEDSDPCQAIPYTIVQKLTKACFSEYTPTCKDEWGQALLKELEDYKTDNEAMQDALIGGECGIKPIPEKDGFSFAVVERKNILVFGRDYKGNLTDIGTAEKSTRGAKYYTLLERRTVDEYGYLTITNTLYMSTEDGELGKKVPLKTLPEYANLVDEYRYNEPIGGLGIAWLRVPIKNCIDGSKDAVSVYAKATGLIENININEAQINGEFERGQSRIITSSDMLKDGKLKDKVFTGMDDDIESTGITIFSPNFRYQSFADRKQEYLRNVESIIGLKRGLLSEVEAVERTATEITSSAGDYNLTIIDLQRAWETTLRELFRLCGIFGKLYNVSGAMEIPEEHINIDWGNGVLYDREAKNNELFTLVSAGLLKPEIYMGWYNDKPTETEADLAKIRKEYMPQIEQLTEE